MAWTDLSSTTPENWGVTVFNQQNVTGVVIPPDDEPIKDVNISAGSASFSWPERSVLNQLSYSYNIPGFENGYQPDSTPSPVNGDLDTPSVGGEWPNARFLYPRGY